MAGTVLGPAIRACGCRDGQDCPAHAVGYMRRRYEPREDGLRDGRVYEDAEALASRHLDLGHDEALERLNAILQSTVADTESVARANEAVVREALRIVEEERGRLGQ